MNTSLFILAIVTFVLAALIPAWPLFSDPLRGRRKRLEQAYSDGIINKEDYRKQTKELESGSTKRRPQLAIILLLAIPLVGLWLYDVVGTPEALFVENITAASTNADGTEEGMTFDEAISALEQRLFDDPDNPANVEGWALLGNSYKNIGRYEDALAAYQKANLLAPENQQLQVDLAEAQLFASPDGQMPPKALELLQSVLASSPNNSKALWLTGVAAYQQRNFDEALTIWRKLRGLVSDPAALQSLDEQIAKAEQGALIASGAAPADANHEMAPDSETATADSASSGGRLVHVRVDFSAELLEQRDDAGSLFVFARTPQGGPPLASVRVNPEQFPLEVDLTDANAMLAGRNLSSAETVIIGARWSKSGEALPRPGDFEGYSGLVNLPTEDTVSVMIDNIR